METDFKIDATESQKIISMIEDKSKYGNAREAIEVAADRVVKRGGCYPGYWTHDMTSNIAIWYMIPFMVIFFVVTLLWEQETPYKNNRKFKDNHWVPIFHYFYSFSQRLIT